MRRDGGTVHGQPRRLKASSSTFPASHACSPAPPVFAENFQALGFPVCGRNGRSEGSQTQIWHKILAIYSRAIAVAGNVSLFPHPKRSWPGLSRPSNCRLQLALNPAELGNVGWVGLHHD
jgi:hypothetical protein